MKPERIVTALFGLAVALEALLLVVGPARATADERFDLGRLERRRHGPRAASAELPRSLALAFSDDARLLENGVALERGGASPESVAALGSGRWCVLSKQTLTWSSSDRSDPLTNGRRYELVVRPNGALSATAIGLAVVAAALGVASWALGGVRLRGPSSPSVRALVMGVAVLSLGAGLLRGWDRILVGPDAPAVLTASPVRTPLYPSFVDALDARRGEPLASVLPDDAVAPRRDGSHRLRHVVQVQKVLTVLAVVALVFELTCGLNAWLVAALAYAGVLVDLLRSGPGAVHFDMNVVGVEGLDHPLVLFFLAVTFAYLRNPTGRKGALVALLLTLLVSNHPSNAALAAVFVVIWALHVARGESLRQATVTTAGLVFVFVLPLAVHVAEAARSTGRFELACTPGSTALPLAVQVATPEDARAFEDEPALRDFTRAILVERVPVLPAFARTVKVPAGEAPEAYAENLFRELSCRLIARHADDSAKLVLIQLAAAWSWALHGPVLAAIAIAAFLYARTRAYELLYVTAFGALPLIAGLAFAAPLALGLLAATLWTLGQRAFDRPGEDV